MKALLLLPAFLALAAPASAEIYTHNSYFSGGVQCSTTLLTLARSSITSCTTPAERAAADRYRAKQAEALRHDYEQAAKRLGFKPECHKYAEQRTTNFNVAGKTLGSVEIERNSIEFQCQYSFARKGRPPADYAAVVATHGKPAVWTLTEDTLKAIER